VSPKTFEAGDSKPSLEPEVAGDIAPIMTGAVIEESFQVDEAIYEYRVYKRRWIGLAALSLLNISAGASFTFRVFGQRKSRRMIPLL